MPDFCTHRMLCNSHSDNNDADWQMKQVTDCSPLDLQQLVFSQININISILYILHTYFYVRIIYSILFSSGGGGGG